MHDVVMVLGDIGRSPRMCYHAASLLGMGESTSVTIIGYAGEQLPAMIANDERVQVVALNSSWINEFVARFRYISVLHALIKGTLLVLTLGMQLLTIPKFRRMLVQNPPALPVLCAALVACRLRLLFDFLESIFSTSELDAPTRREGSRYQVYIDWHNFGFSMYLDRLGAEHVLVRLSRWLEMALAHSVAAGHICVSQAMQQFLIEEFRLPPARVSVLYDRPPAFRFLKQPLAVAEQHKLLVKLGFREKDLFAASLCDGRASIQTAAVDDDEGKHGATTVERELPLLPLLSSAQTRLLLQSATSDASSGAAAASDGLVTFGAACSGRVALVVSSTSWTEDEDFSLLLDALLMMERFLQLRHVLLLRLAASSGDSASRIHRSTACCAAASEDADFCATGIRHRGAHEHHQPMGGRSPSVDAMDPESSSSAQTSRRQFNRVLVAITGKGPLKEMFETRIRRLEEESRLGSFVAVRTVWLEADEYPCLLRCADVGVSLHTSTSGLDLPMKVLDMFGSGVPVCAYSFPALSELVRHGENGMVFSSSEQLARQLLYLLCGSAAPTPDAANFVFPADGMQLLREMAAEAKQLRSWEDNWASVMPMALS